MTTNLGSDPTFQRSAGNPTELGVARAATLFEQLQVEEAAAALRELLAADPSTVDG